MWIFFFVCGGGGVVWVVWIRGMFLLFELVIGVEGGFLDCECGFGLWLSFVGFWGDECGWGFGCCGWSCCGLGLGFVFFCLGGIGVVLGVVCGFFCFNVFGVSFELLFFCLGIWVLGLVVDLCGWLILIILFLVWIWVCLGLW